MIKKLHIKKAALLFVFLGSFAFGQNGGVGIGTETPEASALLELKSTNKALLLPRVADENQIQSPKNGMLIYDEAKKCINSYADDQWQCLTGDSGTTTTTTAPTNPTGTGTFTGRLCFDIVESNFTPTDKCGTQAARLSTKANFADATTHTQSYTFTPTAAVSNVRFLYVNTNGNPIIAISGDNSANNITGDVVATVNYDTELNLHTSEAYGTDDTDALTADIYVVYNDAADGSGTDKQLKLTPKVKDCTCCGAYTAPGVWTTFMCHNLGADESLDPNTPVKGINGDYYQWGRKDPVATPDTTDGSIAGYNQTTNAPVDAWSDTTKTINDPCPEGFRVPTGAQWEGVMANNPYIKIGSNANYVFASHKNNFYTAIHYNTINGDKSTASLTLPYAGYRHGGSGGGKLYDRGRSGVYWSSTQDTAKDEHGLDAHFYNPSVSNDQEVDDKIKKAGHSVRCVVE